MATAVEHTDKKRRLDLEGSLDPVAKAKSWLGAEPDADIRTETEALIAGNQNELVARFSGRLEFGTAGLRAEVGAGPMRMNRLTVRQAAAGLVDHLLSVSCDAKTRGLIIGYDMRRKSDTFAWDTARVAAKRGVKAMILPEPLPTPVLAWNITRTNAAGGVMVTASHNPPADNGYKVYLESGSQIVPPHDAQISAAIGRLNATNIELSDESDPLITVLGGDAWDEYIAWVPSVRLQPSVVGVKIVYTAMHGVGGRSIDRSFQRAGFEAPLSVAEQQAPDGSFPTVSFPNPEEPGSMDLVMALGKSSGAKVALANDPDADRLAVAVPLKNGVWRRLAGDEIGWLLADYILQHTSGNDRLVVTTVVSSGLLSKMAAAHKVAFSESFTGFKWMAHTALQRSDKRLVFAYEQAIGYLVTGRPLDKDGITAALLFAEMAGSLAAKGLTVEDRLNELADTYGKHVVAETSVKMDPAAGAAAVSRLRASPPSEIAGMKVVAVRDFPEANLLRLWLNEEGGKGVRIQIRPSGTEPKVKVYGEAVDADPASALKAAAALLKP